MSAARNSRALRSGTMVTEGVHSPLQISLIPLSYVLYSSHIWILVLFCTEQCVSPRNEHIYRAIFTDTGSDALGLHGQSIRRSNVFSKSVITRVRSHQIQSRHACQNTLHILAQVGFRPFNIVCITHALVRCNALHPLTLR
jgi:hypothetical protein